MHNFESPWASVSSILGLQRWQPLVLATLLMGCSGETTKDTDGGGPTDGDADVDSDADTDVEPECESVIVSVSPEDGAVGVLSDSDVTITFDVPILDTQEWSLEVSNTDGDATLAADGLSATWTGTLEPDTAYSVNASVCDDIQTTQFHTSPPPIDLSTIAGHSYALNWETIELTQPGNSDALHTLIEVEYVLAQIVTVDTDALTADAVATIGNNDGAGGVDPICELAVQQTADFTLNPFFSISGQMTIVVNATTGQTADIEDFEILGQMSEDGEAITNVQISGLVATEQFLEGADCQSTAIQILFPTCLPCTTSATGECMLIEGVAPIADYQVGLDIAAECAGS